MEYKYTFFILKGGLLLIKSSYSATFHYIVVYNFPSVTELFKPITPLCCASLFFFFSFFKIFINFFLIYFYRVDRLA